MAGSKAAGQTKPKNSKSSSGTAMKRARQCRAETDAVPKQLPVVATAKRRRAGSGVHDSVLKVFVSHVKPNYSQPWCSDAQTSSTSSAWPIRMADGSLRIITNAHSVEHAALVQVKRHRLEQKWVAKVLCVGPDCDLALLEVPDPEFWKGLQPMSILPELPALQDSVSVIGYPTGGENLSVTQGVVSRIDLVEYAQNGVTLLGVQIDAAINSGNSGGPVVDAKGNCVGVAFQNLDGSDEDGAENIGYIIPTEILIHFLEDYMRNGRFTGFGSAGIYTQALESPVLRQALGMSKAHSGIRVKAIEPASASHGVLEPDDVILRVDGHKVGNDGDVDMEWGRIPFNYLLNKKFPEESCNLQVLRGDGAGKVKKISLKLVLQRNKNLVDVDAGGPHNSPGSMTPRYIVAGGLVMVPLTQPFLEAAFGEDYADERPSEMPVEILNLLDNGMRESEDHEKLVLTQVLASEVTVGYSDLEYEVLESFNGVKVKNLKHLAELLDANQDVYQKFNFSSKEVVVLDSKKAQDMLPSILEQNMIPMARSLQL